MKRLSCLLSILLCSVCLSHFFAQDIYKTDMDYLLHKAKGHRQGIVVLDGNVVKLKIYNSTSFNAPNGKSYYRWWDGEREMLMSEHDPILLANDGFEPLTYGYRFDEEKMLVYNFQTEEEVVAYDFTLQSGELFTTPDGISWKVVGRRIEEFESTFDYQTDYQNEHLVLKLQSVDGTMTDEWVQYIGSLHHPIQTWGQKNITLARTAFFNFGEHDDKLLCFDFAEDPLYGQCVNANPDPYASTEINRNYFIMADEDKLNITISYYTWFTRHYCYTYRNGNTFDIHSIELGPYRDSGDSGTPSFGLTLSGAPSYDNYTIVYDGKILRTSIEMPWQEEKKHPAFDLSGRRLTIPSTKGIYIRDGRKVVWK